MIDKQTLIKHLNEVYDSEVKNIQNYCIVDVLGVPYIRIEFNECDAFTKGISYDSYITWTRNKNLNDLIGE